MASPRFVPFKSTDPLRPRRISSLSLFYRCYEQNHDDVVERVRRTLHLRSFASSSNLSNNSGLTKETDRSRVRIGSVEIPLGTSTNKEKDEKWLVPSSYLSSVLTSSSSPLAVLKHLQWMMAKDILQQDMLLVGPPGSGEVDRRRLALAYAELTQKPIEILTITGDKTESDLKQRRELVQHQQQTSVQFVDQAPVRAAKYGRLLLLDGIEKAERNVLPG